MKTKRRFCEICGIDITFKRKKKSARFCKVCAEERRRKSRNQSQKLKRRKERKENPEKIKKTLKRIEDMKSAILDLMKRKHNCKTLTELYEKLILRRN